MNNTEEMANKRGKTGKRPEVRTVRLSPIDQAHIDAILNAHPYLTTESSVLRYALAFTASASEKVA